MSRAVYGVAHASRVSVLASRQNDLLIDFVCNRGSEFTRKVRDREDALAPASCRTRRVRYPIEFAAGDGGL